MKIELDLTDIFCEGGEPCDLQEAIREHAVRQITQYLRDGIGKSIEQETARVLQEELQSAVRERMPALLDDLMNAEYTPVTGYGQRGDPTTFRQALVKEITSQLVYKPARYDSDKNAFTRAVDTTVEGKLKEFQALFNKTVDANFTRDALAFATAKLAERLKIK